ncbi:MAG: hypothetical protein MJ252_27490, partial [archaeon]|nr:hypothetical protein [archaeon]
EEKKEEKKEEPPKMEKVKKEKSTLCTLENTDTPYGTMKGILDQIQSRENEQENDDKAYLAVSHKKNAIEQFIYNTREKLDNVLIPHITQEEKEKLNKLMDPVLEWLYSDDENVYNKKALDDHSKDMYELGNKIYARYDGWTKLNENIALLEKAVLKSDDIIKEETEKITKNNTVLIPADIELMKKATENAKKKINEYKGKEKEGNKLEEPKLKGDEVSNYLTSFNKEYEKIYADADFRKKEEERKKKEEEEKKKKEEEEKKKKEEAKKEGEDVEMKDASKEETKKEEEKKEEKKNPDAMDVE